MDKEVSKGSEKGERNEGNKLPLILGAILVVAALALLLMPKEEKQEIAAIDGKVKVGFVYLTNPGDHGWTYARGGPAGCGKAFW